MIGDAEGVLGSFNLPGVENAVIGTVAKRLGNASDALAFFVELRVVDADGNSILPVLWDDNYVSILPGESRELVARFPAEDGVSGARLMVKGWNVAPVEANLVGR